MNPLRAIIEAGVRNPVYANLLAFCILAGGIFAASTLVTETYPEFSLDRIAIRLDYPGASPAEVEEQVIRKAEESIQGLAGIKRYWSLSHDHGGLLVVELIERADARLMILDIKDRLDRVTTFPADMHRPVVYEVLNREQVINLALYGDVPERALKQIIVDIKNELLSLGRVTQVELTGVREDEISIEVSREALLRYGLSLEQVRAVVARNVLDAPAGSVRGGQEELSLRLTGQRYTPREFEDLVVIAQPDGTQVRLGQIARVSDGFEDAARIGRFQGQPAVMLEVFRSPDQDTSTIARSVRDYVQNKRADLPAGVTLDLWADNSREVEARIDMLFKNGIFGVLLVLVTLTLMLDMRVSWYVALGIPISMGGTLMVMYLGGHTLNMITLFGMIMVSGIIVDDAIVVADGFREELARSGDAKQAAVEGPGRVALAVLASSATTVAAFVPLMFVTGIMGKFIAVLPVAVISAIAFSSIECFCVFPSHLQHCRSHMAMPALLGRWRTSFRQRMESRIDGFIQRAYLPWARRTLRAWPLTLAGAGLCLAVAVGWFAGGRLPFTLLPEIDGDMLRVRVQLPYGTALGDTTALARRIEDAANRLNDRAILSHQADGPLIRRVFSVTGEWSDWIDETGSNLCEVVIELAPAEKRRLDGRAVLAAWKQQVGPIDNADSVAFDRLQRGPAEKPLDIRLLGEDLERLEGVADQVVAALGQYAGTVEVQHDLYPGHREARISLTPNARMMGITLEDLARQVRAGFQGGEAVRIQRGREEVRVEVRYPGSERQSLGDLQNLRINIPGGGAVPFQEVAHVEVARGYAIIRHHDGWRYARITGGVDERTANAEQILTDFETQMLKELPYTHAGIDYRLVGQRAQIVESLQSLKIGFALAIIVIYGILAGMLVSYWQPFIIMLTIPVGFAGSVLGHVVMGYDLTIMSVFGLVTLAGVVVNDAIVLIDRINMNRLAGLGAFEAALESGGARFRAVMLTTVTTLAGLAPLMLERSAQAQSLIPMAISLTWGLAFATLLTLFVIPAFYLAGDRLRCLLGLQSRFVPVDTSVIRSSTVGTGPTS